MFDVALLCWSLKELLFIDERQTAYQYLSMIFVYKFLRNRIFPLISTKKKTNYHNITITRIYIMFCNMLKLIFFSAFFLCRLHIRPISKFLVFIQYLVRQTTIRALFWKIWKELDSKWNMNESFKFSYAKKIGLNKV